MNKIKLPMEYFKGNGITVQKAQISRQRIIEIIKEAIEADRQTPDDTVLTCDSCGVICQNPWHTSHGENRHVHLCDACYEADRQRTHEWRKLALQFDSHRMQAIGHLKAIVDHLPVDMQSPIRNFLSAAPDRQTRITSADLDLAAEIWAAAQTVPGEGIEDAENRIAAILADSRQARGDTIYMVQHCSEKNRWQVTTKERFFYLKEYENRGDWEFMAVTI